LIAEEYGAEAAEEFMFCFHGGKIIAAPALSIIH
jgi:hypothetical protein